MKVNRRKQMNEIDISNAIGSLAEAYGVPRSKVAVIVDGLGAKTINVGTARIVLASEMHKIKPALERLKGASANGSD